MAKPEVTEITLANSGDQVWVEVGNMKVNVQRTDEGVVCDTWALNPTKEVPNEMEMIKGDWTLFTEAEEDNEDTP
jgi:hypothetical protein